jgi:WD40 repeat protein
MKHGEAVYRAHFSPDGKRILTSSWDNTARLWDAQTGLRIAEPMKHSDVIVAAEFSPDGKRILTASHDGSARIWDVQTGQPLTEPMKQRSALLSARWSPDGKRVATASFDDTARVWDVGPNPSKYPDWLLQLSEAISGQVFNNQAVLEPTKLNRLETINQIRDRLAKADDNDEWVVWGRWLLADRNTRAISPFSKMTSAEYDEVRARLNGPITRTEKGSAKSQ